jgi:hypothetical protein
MTIAPWLSFICVPETCAVLEVRMTVAPTSDILTAKMAKTTISGDVFFINFVVIKLPVLLLRKTQVYDYIETI